MSATLKQFATVSGGTCTAPLVVEGPRGIVCGVSYFSIYLVDATGRFRLHSHGYDRGDWMAYFRSIVGL